MAEAGAMTANMPAPRIAARPVATASNIPSCGRSRASSLWAEEDTVPTGQCPACEKLRVGELDSYPGNAPHPLLRLEVGEVTALGLPFGWAFYLVKTEVNLS
jgi:hypothetical protein